MKKSFLIIAFLLMICGAIVYSVVRPQFVSRKAIDNPVNIEQLKQTVEYLTSYNNRSFDNPKVLQKIAQDLKANLMHYSQKVTLQVVPVGAHEYYNVVAHFGPTADEKNKPIVIGAHYDAYNHFPGADDNASGVAGVLAIAQLLSHVTIKKPIILVAYVLEEPPYFGSTAMGSSIHAQSLAQNNQSLELMISLEMIGYFSQNQSQVYPIPGMNLLYPRKGNFIAIVDQLNSSFAVDIKKIFNSQTSMEAYSFNALQNINGVTFSDHSSYWDLGMPAVMITDTAFLRNPHYHQPTDTADSLNYQKMAETVWGVFLFLKNKHYLTTQG